MTVTTISIIFSTDIQTIVSSVLIGAASGAILVWLFVTFRWNKKINSSTVTETIETPNINVLAQVNKQLIPFLPEFLTKYNPKDARFLGSPIDLIIFDGLDKGNLKRIVFVETRTGTAQLNEKEQMIKNIIESKRVEWEILEKE